MLWQQLRKLERLYSGFSKPRFWSGQVRPRQGTEICNFGAPSPLEALHWIFCAFSPLYVQFSKTSPLKSGESSEKSSGENRVKSCHVCGCHGFFGPDLGNLCFAPWILVVFVISVLSVISANPAINPLACGCPSCLRHFCDSRRFREKHRNAKHRFGKTYV